MGMHYGEACEATVSRHEALMEVKKHFLRREWDAQWELFLSEVGDKQEYEGQEVLDWLGY